MKTKLIAGVIVLWSISSFSQSYKKVKVGLGFGVPSGIIPSLLHIEPAYRVNDRWAIGARMEGAFVSKKQKNFTSASLGVNGQLYFSEPEKFRPFMGAGVSLFFIEQTGLSCDCTIKTERNTFGFYPRVDFDTGHFIISFEYNVVPDIKQTTTSWDGVNSTSYFNANYFAMKVSGFIGGGKKKRL
jgi:hypothetical protein